MRGLVLAAIFAAALGAAPGGASAQTNRGVYGTELPWERALKRFYGREKKLLEPPRYDPNTETNKALGRVYRDPGKILGLPRNVVPTTPKPPEVVGAPQFDPRISRLDTNNDGAISQEEYYIGKRRPPRAGRSNRAYDRMNRRLRSQFRALDANGDGRVTAEEYGSVPNARF